ncbi:cell wall hydrolase/autolysin [Caldicellulosiruptor hydrothermalis 108]|uniref:Cell wall hydrolase/autolysin n=1 Tax=Caldicellulosiruptor hydrothermalis (strain DSM 18901 / VKM B-2411 / 108) TaxID=632292 RepID=E4QC79_CALH1|nr:N-acetylmuramoyl-L-alanine amidase [Caldicellulosiruptor hydrothermalis]ADQ07371.1 cell wall hydrolase/autolysin [Caldicellulosiruptor hydrothermalis 108]
MNKIRNVVTIVIVFFLLFMSVFAATSYKLYIDGKLISSVKILESKGNVYLALGDFFKLKGFSVTYDSKSKAILAKKSKDTYQFYVDKTFYYYNKTKKELLAKIIINKGKSYIMAKDLASIFNYLCQFDKNRMIVVFNTNRITTSLVNAFQDTTYNLYIESKFISSVKALEGKDNVYLALAQFLKLVGFNVSYDSKTKKVLAKRLSDTYEFYIDKEFYYYNKTKKTLSAKVFVKSGKSYILAKDLASIFGYSYQTDKTKKMISLNTKKSQVVQSSSSKNQISNTLTSRSNLSRTVQETNYITDIKYTIENNKFILIVSATQTLSYKDYKLFNPDRIVLDVLNSIDNLQNNRIEINKNGIFRIRHAQNIDSSGNKFSRIVIDYDSSLIKNYKVINQGNQIKIEIDLPKVIESKTNIDSSEDYQTPGSQNSIAYPSQIYMIQKIDVIPSDGFTLAQIEISPTVVSDIYRADESFVVLNLKGAQFLVQNNNLYQVNDGRVDFYVLSNIDQDSSQIIFSSKAKVFVLNRIDGKLEVVFADQYSSLRVNPPSSLVLSSPFVSQINYFYDQSSNTIRLESQYPITIADDVYSLQGSVVTTVYSVYQQDKCIVYIQINPNYIANISKSGTNITISFSQKLQKPQKKLKIFIDPGHGGSDPGAIYTKVVNGKKVTYNEKDFNLDISLRLREKLKSLGYEVYMSRDKDVYVDLYDRTRMANSLNADLFISIHNNAIDNSSVRGTMVLYKEKQQNGLISDKQFAQIVLESIVKQVGTQNKGIVERPNLAVLRTSSMPAVLVEVAFGTNPQDLDLLLSDSFKDAVAKAIADAVEYINENYNR